MIYLIMCGRLGNQLFQYAFARYIQEQTGQSLAIDFTAVNQMNSDEWRDYLVDYNVVDYKVVQKMEYFPIQRIIYRLLKTIRPKMNEKNQYKFDEFISRVFGRFGIIFYESDYRYHDFKKIISSNIVIRGWFESDKYFSEIEDIIRKEFTLKEKISLENTVLAKRLMEDISICITVRRGNYTEGKNRERFLVCSLEYYYKGVEYIRNKYPNALIYVCSDDIEWCKRELKFEGEVLFEPSNCACVKLYLMSLCTHFVLSNSTFSWWAQYLSTGRNKIVVSPVKWKNSILPPEDIFSDDWVLMDSQGMIYDREEE